MKYIQWIFLTFIYSITLSTCNENTGNEVNIPMPPKTSSVTNSIELSPDEYYDKVLGALVGSAIGDAMGASTEMWYRADIQKKYGYINGLTTALREKSPEGTWRSNMVSGATTDDTRWKYLVGQYFKQNRGNLSDQKFADYISNYYQSLAQKLSDEETLRSTDILDEKIDQLNWIKEWARVSMAFQKGGPELHQAQNRFYGGEMSCAGMLYTPMFGLIEKSPELAYTKAYEHAFFDIGYARDISGLVAAMTSIAFQTNDIDSILDIHLYVDPYDYNDSRLIGRLAGAIANESRLFVEQSQNLIIEDTVEAIVPEGYLGSKEDWIREDYIFSELEKKQKAIAFHAGEIWQILFTGMEYGAGDFEKTMRFIVNYGRDNDTVAAVAGMILGAKDGFKNLPPDHRDEVLKVNREVIGIDLEELAKDIVGRDLK